MEKRKKLAMEKVLQPVSDKELEININDIYPSEKGLGVFNAFKWRFKMGQTDELSRLMGWVTA